MLANTMKKILIVDDDMTFQTTMTAKLRSLGYEVLCAADGEEGLEKAEHEKPDLILLDIKMPKLDGISMLKKLQANKNMNERVPVIITSNLSTIDTISEGIALGVKGYIIKSEESLDSIAMSVEKALNPPEGKVLQAKE